MGEYVLFYDEYGNYSKGNYKIIDFDFEVHKDDILYIDEQFYTVKRVIKTENNVFYCVIKYGYNNDRFCSTSLEKMIKEVS